MYIPPVSKKQDFNAIEAYYRTALEKEPYNYEFIISLSDYYANVVSNDNKARYYYELALDVRKDDCSLYLKIVDLDTLSLFPGYKQYKEREIKKVTVIMKGKEHDLRLANKLREAFIKRYESNEREFEELINSIGDNCLERLIHRLKGEKEINKVHSLLITIKVICTF